MRFFWTFELSGSTTIQQHYDINKRQNAWEHFKGETSRLLLCQLISQSTGLDNARCENLQRQMHGLTGVSFVKCKRMKGDENRKKISIVAHDIRE